MMHLKALGGMEDLRSGTGRRLNGRIQNSMGAAIVGGKWRPGQLLPSELEAAHQLNVSRTAYREAVRILVGKGLLDCRPQSGIRVRSRTDWNLLDPDVLTWGLSEGADPKLLRDIEEMRLTLEPAAASVAAGRRTAGDLLLLRGCVAGLHVHNGQAELRSRYAELHYLVMKATNNPAFTTVGAGIRVAVQLGRQALHVDHLLEAAKALYSAVERQDGQSAACVVTHIIIDIEQSSGAMI